MPSSAAPPSPEASPLSRPRSLEFPRHVVTAVLVAHDGHRWLPDAIAALQWQRRPPQRIVAVDTGSTDETRATLDRELGAESVLTAPRDCGFGAAVQRALDALQGAPEPAMPGRPQGSESIEWVWLLHDDCAPAPDALRHMLDLADTSPSAVVIGPKQHSWYRPGVIVEAGFSVDTSGRRETGLESNEVDQGQHDSVSDVLAVGSAGALIRRDVWDALGGFDPNLKLFRDDLDFCWRTHLAGHRVVVAPRAVVRHAEAGRRGDRRLAATGSRTRRIDRSHALYTLLTNLSAAGLWITVPRLILGSLLRALGLLLGKRPGDAADELAAIWSVCRHPARIAAARRRRTTTRTMPPRSIRPLLTGRSVRLRHYADAAAGWVSDRVRTEAPSVPSSLETGPTTADEDLEAIGAAAFLRRVFIRPGPLLVLGLTAVALVAERSLLGSGSLAGGQLLPAPSGASDLWSSFVSSWHPGGQGSDAVAPPYLAVLAGLSVLTLGKAWLAVDVLLLGCVPLAGLTAYVALGRLTRWWPARVWGAATYALLPVATGVVAGGRVGTALAIIALPLLVVSCVHVLRTDPKYDGWRHVWGAALFLSAVTACAPLLYVIALPVLVAGTVAVRLRAVPTVQGAAIRRGLASAIVAVAPLALLFPWSLTVLGDPGLVLRTPGPVVPGLTDTELSPWHIAVAAPGGPGTPAAWLTVPLLLAGLAGLIRVSGRTVARAVWGVVLLAVAVGILVAHLTISGGAAGESVVGWPGIATAVVGLGLVAAGVVAADGMGERLRRVTFGWRQPTATVLAALAVLVPVAVAVVWVTNGADDPIDRGDIDIVRADIAARAATGVRPEILVLEADGDVVHQSVIGSRPPQLGDGDAPSPQSQVRRLNTTVSELAANRGVPSPSELLTNGIQYVLISDVDSRVSARLAARLDATPNLSRLPANDDVALWTVIPDTGRVLVLPKALAAEAATLAAPDPQTLAKHPPTALPAVDDGAHTSLDAGPPGRLLVLNHPTDAAWRATLDGEPLERTTAWGWAQAYQLPTAGGHLRVWHDAGYRPLALAIEGVLVGMLVVLAWPAARRRSDAPLPPPPAAPPANADRAQPEDPAVPAPAPTRNVTVRSRGTS